jgi:hypothetical protein
VAYTTPPTFSAGAALAAADLNILGADITYLKGIADGVGFSGTRVTRAANTSIADSTDSLITFTAEAYDYGGWYSSGTNVVVPAGAIPGGYTTIAVMVIAQTTWHANGTGRRYVYAQQNGSNIAGVSFTGDSGEDMFEAVTGFAICAAGDTLSLDVKQTSGGALNCYNSQLIVVRYAPAA